MFSDYIPDIKNKSNAIISKDNQYSKNMIYAYHDGIFYVCPKCKNLFRYRTIKCQLNFKKLDDFMYEHIGCGGHIYLMKTY